MPSYLASGLAEGVSPFAKAIGESALKRKEERRKAQEAPSQAISFVKALEQAGIPITQLSSVNPQEGTVGFRNPPLDINTLATLLGGGGGVTDTGEADASGMLLERLRSGPATFVNPKAVEARAAAATKGKGLNVQESSQLENFQTAVDSISKIEENLTGSQGRYPNLIQAALPFSPGQRGLAFDLKNVQDTLLRMRSGAQINEKEYSRLKALLPVWQDVVAGEPGVVQKKLSTFKNNFSSVLERQRRRGFSSINSDGIEGKSGGEEVVDANGNRAIMYPDGSYEEIE